MRGGHCYSESRRLSYSAGDELKEHLAIARPSSKLSQVRLKHAISQNRTRFLLYDDIWPVHDKTLMTKRFSFFLQIEAIDDFLLRGKREGFFILFLSGCLLARIAGPLRLGWY